MATVREQDLLERARGFDLDALAEIYDHYSPKLYAYAVRMLGDEDLAEDCVAESFSRFLSALRSGGGPHDFLQAYLYRVAHNWITDRYRREPPAPLELKDNVFSGDLNPPDAGLEDKLRQEQVRRALRVLTPEQRQVLMLKYVQGCSNEEVAAALQKPLGAVKALQHRGLAALRRLLQGEEGNKNEV